MSAVLWRGQIFDATEFLGEVIVAEGVEIPASEVLYPTWDPSRGLSLTGMKSSHKLSELIGDRTTFGPFLPPHKLAMTLPGVTDSTPLEQVADALIERVRMDEPKVTRDMQAVVQHEGGEMRGLEHRIKSRDSLLRKLMLKGNTKGLGPVQLVNDIKDVLRYTMVYSPVGWGLNVQDSLWGLEERGYRVKEEENFWEKGDDYSGLHYVLESPSGINIELQFHSDDSHRLKESTLHKLYEEFRDPNTSKVRKQELFDAMAKEWEHVPIPDWALEFPRLTRHQRPASLNGEIQVIALTEKSAMVALRPQEDFCESLYGMVVERYGADYVEDLDNYHVTVAYIPEVDDPDLLDACVQQWVGRWGPMEGRFGGFGVFHNNNKVLMALIDIPRLEAVREDLLEILAAHGFDVPKTHGYTAHLTLAYFGEANTPAPPEELDQNASLTFGYAISAVGDSWHEYDFVGPRDHKEAILHDEPEAALPEAYGTEDDDEAEVAEWLQAKALRGLGDRTAVRKFSPDEQKTIIEEGQGVQARNLGSLDLTGTHYLAADDDDEWWMI